MSNIEDFTGKNRRFTGNIGIDVSTGTTGQRATTFGSGTLRFNSTTNLLEYYTGTDWKSIDSPPLITNFTLDGGSSVTTAAVDNEASGDMTLVIAGSLFDTTGATVTLVGTSETLSTQSLVRNSANQLTATFTRTQIDNSNSPYTLKVTNGSGLAASLADAITNDTGAPAWYNAADTNANIFDGGRGSVSIAADNGFHGASNATAGTWSVSSGSLPSGLSMNASTGAITGSTDAVGSDSVTTFTIQVTGDELAGTRQFTITRKAPQRSTYTSGSGQYSVPSGLTSVDALVIASGGPGGARSGGGGGAGGMIERAGFTVSPGAQLSYSVGGQGPQPSNGTAPTRGSNSTFGTLTALAGGAGQMDTQGQIQGGSGGGRHYDQAPTGQGQQPGQPGDSGNYGHGNPGGVGAGAPYHAGGGGGGAGSTGGSASSAQQGNGGQGRASNYSGSSVTYAGGGGAGGHPNAGPGGSAGPGGAGHSNPGGNQSGNAATANRGSGGGGAFQSSSGGRGASGIIIVKY